MLVVCWRIAGGALVNVLEVISFHMFSCCAFQRFHLKNGQLNVEKMFIRGSLECQLVGGRKEWGGV